MKNGLGFDNCYIDNWWNSVGDMGKNISSNNPRIIEGDKGFFHGKFRRDYKLSNGGLRLNA